MNKFGFRSIFFLATALAVIVSPWWIFGPIVVLQTLYVKNYVEVIFFGFLVDILYSVQYPFPYTFLVFSTVFIILVMFVKTRIRT